MRSRLACGLLSLSVAGLPSLFLHAQMRGEYPRGGVAGEGRRHLLRSLLPAQQRSRCWVSRAAAGGDAEGGSGEGNARGLRAVELGLEHFSMLSTQGVIYRRMVSRMATMPRGGAFRTEDTGRLKEQGIHSLIFAAPGVREWSEPVRKDYAPCVSCVRTAVKNAMILANRSGARRVAIPLVGGEGFARAMGVSIDELADAVVGGALEEIGSCELVFVDSEVPVVVALQEALDRALEKETLLPDHSREVYVLQGLMTELGDTNVDCLMLGANFETTQGSWVDREVAEKAGGLKWRKLLERRALLTLQFFHQEVLKTLVAHPTCVPYSRWERGP